MCLPFRPLFKLFEIIQADGNVAIFPPLILNLTHPSRTSRLHDSSSQYRPTLGGISLLKSNFKKTFRRFRVFMINRNRNRKLLISRAPTKAKSQEPAYSQALNQNKIDRQRSRSRESGRQTVRRLWWMVFGVETGR